MPKEIVKQPSNKALHRTAICDCVLPWGFSFISQVVAVGELYWSFGGSSHRTNMGADLLICPKEDAAPITVEQIRERLFTAGLPCNIETHDGEPWIVFDGHESDLVFTVEADGRAASAV